MREIDVGSVLARLSTACAGRVVSVAATVVITLAAAPARAQWAVIDVHAIAQLTTQVQVLEQQLANARSQLQTAAQQYQSLTGGRGMELLLAGTVRNYLPANWNQLSAALQPGGGAYAALGVDVQTALSANAVLSAQGLAALSPADRQQILNLRQTTAMSQALSRQALANASSRFDAIQTLINSIAAAGDPKAILDLQTRIAAEQGMLQNEQTKLQILGQLALAQDAAGRQQQLENSVAGHGQFQTRFRPVP
jgi:type IV secretion system protein VirB5